MRIKRVRADTSEHIASRRVMEKAGMRFVREAKEDVDGETRDVVFYQISSSEDD